MSSATWRMMTQRVRLRRMTSPRSILSGKSSVVEIFLLMRKDLGGESPVEDELVSLPGLSCHLSVPQDDRAETGLSFPSDSSISSGQGGKTLYS